MFPLLNEEIGVKKCAAFNMCFQFGETYVTNIECGEVTNASEQPESFHQIPTVG